jgi:hypothetical protein
VYGEENTILYRRLTRAAHRQEEGPFLFVLFEFPFTSGFNSQQRPLFSGLSAIKTELKLI